MPRTKVLLADDHAVVAQGLAALLGDTFELAGVVHDGRALLAALETLRPDVVVTDISMPLLNGIQATRQIMEHFPQSRVLILSANPDPAYIEEAVICGASGYLIASWHPNH